MADSMDPDLVDQWTTVDPPSVCGACLALSKAQKKNEDHDHPSALRYIVGVSEGWEQVRQERSAARRERAAADQ